MFITPQSHVFSSQNSLLLSKNEERRDKKSIKSWASPYLFSLFHLFQTALFLSFFRTKYASKYALNTIMTTHFLTTKNTKETKIRCCKRYFTQDLPIRCFLYITPPFPSFPLISLLISSVLFRKIERLFLKKEPQQHKNVSIITFFVWRGCT